MKPTVLFTLEKDGLIVYSIISKDGIIYEDSINNLNQHCTNIFEEPVFIEMCKSVLIAKGIIKCTESNTIE